MQSRRLLLFGLVCVILALAACGGGGGANAPQPTTAKLTLSTSGTLPLGTFLAGIGINISLPAGVTVNTDASGAVSSGVVNVTGVAAPGAIVPVYTPASGATPARLALVMVSNAPAGFGTGEFAVVNCSLSGSVSPTAADFVLTDFKPIDLNGATVTGLSASAILN